MASNMLPLIRPVAVPTPTSSAGGHKSPKWRAPLSGFSTEPGDKKAKSRVSPGSFTEEKARQLRKMTSDASSFHETMYHSAIASRLASDFSGDHFAA